ncbi:hypothetical protein OCU04_005596 [Sclerotinia nivalis]|uniref:Uncharacterized protein n=1 Tax=Sclerotinia nivalis TaxID=352851 RepID=A0A9X0DLC8_9HELO|nr:hypothetical protein OCU04_005596 [Sclerotinia nivalis]
MAPAKPSVSRTYHLSSSSAAGKRHDKSDTQPFTSSNRKLTSSKTGNIRMTKPEYTPERKRAPKTKNGEPSTQIITTARSQLCFFSHMTKRKYNN